MNRLAPRRALLTMALTAVSAGGIAGCGGETPASSSTPTESRLVVSAATSLKKPFTAYGAGFDQARVSLSFAGSDALGAQIRAGLRPGVFASANTKLPDALFKEGLVEQPVIFATNELVLAVPVDGAKVSSVDDLGGPGVKIAIGAEGVPVGDYTRTVLGRLPAAQSKAILANVRTSEPDVGGVVGKLTQGAVDAGFVYASDVQGAGGKIRAINLPVELEPTVQYGVAVVKDAKNPGGAKAFIDGLRSGSGAGALRANGFGVPSTP